MSARHHQLPKDAANRRAVKLVLCYPNDTLPAASITLYQPARLLAEKLMNVLCRRVMHVVLWFHEDIFSGLRELRDRKWATRTCGTVTI